MKCINTLHANDSFLHHLIVITVELRNLHVPLACLCVVIPCFKCVSTLPTGRFSGPPLPLPLLLYSSPCGHICYSLAHCLTVRNKTYQGLQYRPQGVTIYRYACAMKHFRTLHWLHKQTTFLSFCFELLPGFQETHSY